MAKKLLNKPDARRMAELAIQAGCTIKVEVDGYTIEFTPYQPPAKTTTLDDLIRRRAG